MPSTHQWIAFLVASFLFVQVPGPSLLFTIGRALTVRDGGDVTILSCGPMLTEALAAADLLEADGVSARVVHIGTIKPFDAAGVVDACAGVGIAGLIAWILADQHWRRRDLAELEAAGVRRRSERGAGA